MIARVWLVMLLLVAPASHAAVLSWQASQSVSTPSDVVVSGDGKQIYVASALSNSLLVYSRNADGTFGGLLQSVASADLVNPWRLLLSGSDLYVLTRNDAGAVLLFRRGADGKLTATAQDSESVTNPSDLALSPAGDQLYVRAAGDNSLSVFNRDSATGALTLLQKLNGLAGDGRVLVSGDGKFIYTSSVANGNITLFSRAANNQLSLVKSYKNGDAGITDLNGVLALALSPNQKHLYAGNGAGNSIAVFGRDAITGELSFKQLYKQGELNSSGNSALVFDGLNKPLGLKISADGQRLYVLGIPSDSESTLSVLRSDPLDGSLSFIESRAGLGGAFQLALAPAGDRLYSAGFIDNSVGIFQQLGANLSLRIESSAAVVSPGETLMLTLVVSNNSSNSVDGVSVVYLLPDGAGAITVNHAGCVIQSGAVKCELAALPAGQTNIKIGFSAPSISGVLNTSAVVFSAYNDSNPADNQASLATQVNGFVNSVPEAVPDLAKTLPGKSISFDIVANDTDKDGQSLAIVPASIKPQSADTRGTLVIDSADPRKVVYTPPAAANGKEFSGREYFTYRISDGTAESADGLITVVVNTPPLAIDDSVTITAAKTVNVYVLVNDYDAEDDTLLLAAVDGSALQGGSAGMNVLDGTVSYTPNPGFLGTEIVTYTVIDSNEAIASATLKIKVVEEDAIKADETLPLQSATSADGGGGGGAFDALLISVLSLMLFLPGRRFKCGYL